MRTVQMNVGVDVMKLKLKLKVSVCWDIEEFPFPVTCVGIR